MPTDDLGQRNLHKPPRRKVTDNLLALPVASESANWREGEEPFLSVYGTTAPGSLSQPGVAAYPPPLGEPGPSILTKAPENKSSGPR